MRRVELAALGEQPHHERRARHRDESAQHDGVGGCDAERRRERRDRRDREPDLGRAGEERRTTEAAQRIERELQPDLEEQEHDAQLGEHADLAGIADDVESARPEQCSHHEEAPDRGQADALEERHADCGDRHHDHELEEQLRLVHAADHRAKPARRPGRADSAGRRGR